MIFIIIISLLLSCFTGALGYFFGLFMALLFFWSSKFSWSEFGIGKPKWGRTILLAFAFTMVLFLLVDVCVQPFIEISLGNIDLSSFDWLRGNTVSYFSYLLFMWIVAAFGEEFVYRGFFVKQLARVFGNTNKSWLISAVTISVLFGLAHLYQGVSGMITTGIIGLFLALIFYKNRNNLILAMLVHGFYDTIGITLIYLNQDRVIFELIQNVINS